MAPSTAEEECSVSRRLSVVRSFAPLSPEDRRARPQTFSARRSCCLGVQGPVRNDTISGRRINTDMCCTGLTLVLAHACDQSTQTHKQLFSCSPITDNIPRPCSTFDLAMKGSLRLKCASTTCAFTIPLPASRRHPGTVGKDVEPAPGATNANNGAE